MPLPSVHQLQIAGRLELEVWLLQGQGLHRPEEKGEPEPLTRAGCIADLGLYLPGGGNWSIPPSHGVRHVGTFARISFARQAEQKGRECNYTWFSMRSELCFGIARRALWSAHLAVLVFSRGAEFNITKCAFAAPHRCLCMNEKVKLGRTGGFMAFDFSLTSFVQSLFTFRYSNQGHPFIVSARTAPQSVEAPAAF